MMAIMLPAIRPSRVADIAAVVAFSIRVWAPVFESFRTVLGERVSQALYPDFPSVAPSRFTVRIYQTTLR
jgi:hypothetical protein